MFLFPPWLQRLFEKKRGKGKHSKSGSRTYEISEPLQVTLAQIAKHERRPEDELFSDIVEAGLHKYISKDKLQNRWDSLTPREQEIAALVCLGYTNRQISSRLNISPETVKARLQRALMKFDVNTRSQLSMLLKDWDFSAFDKPRSR
jgi:RNA polymerase sigma factor (sigma-70 family)